MMDIEQLVCSQRKWFSEGRTLSLSFRHEMLRRLKQYIQINESKIHEALKADLGKSNEESYMCETGMTLLELDYLDKHLDKFWKKRRVTTPVAQFHSSSFTVREPYGIVLIMSPWNYPFMLTMEPLIGAIACGNCCVVKPSAYSPNVSRAIKEMINTCFPTDYIEVIEGGHEENEKLLKQKFDYIFFTGGTKVGRIVMEQAAKNLTPVTLELGGKSPVVIDCTAKLKLAAKRVAFGKLLNCGQTCVAPDYVLIHEDVEDKFVEYYKHYVRKMLGEDPLNNDDYVHMINRKHYDRVIGLIDKQKVCFGGNGDPENLRIEPTVMTGVTKEDAVMNEEIFGPVLPLITFKNIQTTLEFIKERSEPLACYLFSEDRRTQQMFMEQVRFGGGCINDTIIHLATSRMGFGGVGSSGMGCYHGIKSIETFSHEKSIVKKHTWVDLPVRYAPYGSFKDKLVHLLVRMGMLG